MTKVLQVLVVEDEPMNREIAEVILSNYGHRVTSCQNGREALKLATETDRRFDLILMDVLMPIMDGLAATRALRSHPATQDVPIICVSAKASGADQGAGIEAGCDHYLNKPYRRHELIEAIDQVLRQRGLLGESESIGRR